MGSTGWGASPLCPSSLPPLSTSTSALTSASTSASTLDSTSASASALSSTLSSTLSRSLRGLRLTPERSALSAAAGAMAVVAAAAVEAAAGAAAAGVAVTVAAAAVAAAAVAVLVPSGCRALAWALVRLGGSCGVSHLPPLEMPMCARLPLRMARCLPASSIKAVKVASACVSTAALSCFGPSRRGQLLPSSRCSSQPACRAKVTSGLPVVPTMIIAPRSIGTPQTSSVSTRPPSRFCASSTVTEWPIRRSCAAAASPASPAPMTMTLRRGVAADGGMRSVN